MTSVETRYGNLLTLNPGEDLISRFLEHYGEWAWLETTFLSHQFDRPIRLLDLGAFLGTFTLGMCRQSNVAYACCIDANSAIFHRLEANLALCSIPIDCENALVLPSDSPSAEAGWMKANNSGTLSFASEAQGDIRVPPPDVTRTADDLIDEYGPFDLIKIDIEGMERQIVRSLHLSRKVNCPFWLECNELSSSLELFDELQQWGLPIWYFAWPASNPTSFRNGDRPIIPLTYEAGLLVGMTQPKMPPDCIAAGCILRRVETRDDLRAALFHTPRDGSREWAALSKSELLGMLSHARPSDAWEAFLVPASAGRPAEGLQDLKNLNELLSGALIQAEKGHRLTLAAMGKLHEDRLTELRKQLTEDRQSSTDALKTLETSVASLNRDLETEKAALRAVKKSTSYRFGRSVAKLAKRVPLLGRPKR